MKRILDFTAALVLLAIAALPMLIIAAAIRLTSRGPALHWSERVGRNNVIFKMPKFRTMRLGAPDLATHLNEQLARRMLGKQSHKLLKILDWHNA